MSNKLYEISMPLLLAALIAVESSGRPKAVSKAGARGLCQIMRPTWEWICKDILKKPYGWEEAFDGEKNKEVAVAYILWIRKWLKKHKAKWQSPELDLVLAAYNCGPGRLRKAKFDVQRCPKSTRVYIRKVKAALRREVKNAEGV